MKLRQYMHQQIVERDSRRRDFLRQACVSPTKRAYKKMYGTRYNHVFRSAKRAYLYQKRAYLYHWCVERMNGLPF